MTGYAIRGGRPGYERLKLLARARWRDTAQMLGRVGLRPGMRCLDLGCGGGEVTIALARSAAPGLAVGIDMDPVKLPAPELRLVQGMETAEEVRGLMLSTLDATAEAICAEGIASEAEVRAALASLAAHTASPGSLIAEPRIFQLSCRRPEATDT